MSANSDNDSRNLGSNASRGRASARGFTKTSAARRGTIAVTVAALLTSLALGAHVIRDEWLSARTEAAVVRDLDGSAPLSWKTGGSADLCAVTTCPPRALAASGVQLILKAQAEPNPALRKPLLALAQDRLARALAVHPSSGGWLAWAAYGRALGGENFPAVSEVLAKSYAASPFLLREGPWRAHYGATHWEQLSPALRTAVVNEVVWLRDVNPPAAAATVAAFTDPPASAALREAWAARPTSSVADRRSGSPGRVHLTR